MIKSRTVFLQFFIFTYASLMTYILRIKNDKNTNSVFTIFYFHLCVSYDIYIKDKNDKNTNSVFTIFYFHLCVSYDIYIKNKI